MKIRSGYVSGEFHQKAPKKKCANMFKFGPQFAACFPRNDSPRREYVLSQYRLLCQGIRDVRISDAGCSAWPAAGGAW